MSIMPNTRFAKGDIIFNEGFPPNGVYYICDGIVEVSKIRGEQKITLATLKEGNIFGEMSLIDARPRSATITALEDTWCYHASPEVFKDKLKQTDYAVKSVLEDWVSVIRHNSNVELNPLNDDLQGEIEPYRTREEIANDSTLQKKVEELDVFMRAVFHSLKEAVYAEKTTNIEVKK